MARILSAKRKGEPGLPQPSRNWPRIVKPMLAIRSVRTLRKVDESDGRTMPESRGLLQRAGVGQRQQSPRVVRQASGTEPAGQNLTRVKAASPTNGGKVKKT